eukprot:144959_1
MSSRKFLSITTSFAAVPCFALNNKNNNMKDTGIDHDELLLVHVFHRHGDRTPWYSIHNYEQSKNTWVPTISPHYSSFNQSTYEAHNIDTIHSWQNISSKLRGISLAFKHDNWTKHSATVFDSMKQNDIDRLSDISTLDNKEHPFLGQLTEKGCKELEHVGKQLRKRYVDTMKHLPAEYDETSNNLHCHSTNVSRTIQSADCVLHELYPMDKRKDNARIPLYVDVDITYLSPHHLKWRFCDKLKQKAMDNEKKMLARLDDKFHALVDMVMHYYDVGANDWTYSNHATVFDGMFCRLSHDMEDRPQQFTNECLKEFGKYMVRLHCAMMGLDRETLKLTWGNVLRKMMEYMKSADHATGKNGHMIISSCHDDSLLAMLCSIYGDSIHYADLEWPPYGSYIIFELWKDANTNNKYVKVLYNGFPLNAFDGTHRIDLECLEQKWKDIIIDEVSYFNEACVC